jgi:hypothetical protein
MKSIVLFGQITEWSPPRQCHPACLTEFEKEINRTGTGKISDLVERAIRRKIGFDDVVQVRSAAATTTDLPAG